MAGENFDGLRVLALESRRATEMATLISTFGGRPTVAPALREVPLDSNPAAVEFAAALMRGEIDITIFLTGVGTRALAAAIKDTCPLEVFAAALARTKVVARGPKPLAVLREWQVPVWVAAPEPNTWQELLAALDAKAASEAGPAERDRPLAGARIAVQEYGVSNDDLLDALRRRGARVSRVPVYRWALPEDVGPLRDAASAIAHGEIDLVMFTTGVQVVHLWQMVTQGGLEAGVRQALARTVIASIGPSTSQELRRHGVEPDLEASHPKLGWLVRQAAEQSGALLRAKRGG
jgi:uroporphyrinogen-III synthase